MLLRKQLQIQLAVLQVKKESNKIPGEIGGDIQKGCLDNLHLISFVFISRHLSSNKEKHDIRKGNIPQYFAPFKSYCPTRTTMVLLERTKWNGLL